MTDNARKVSELPTANTIGSSDRIVFLYQANTSPSVRTITLSNLAAQINVNTGNVVFTQYNAPWEQTYPVITTKVSADLNVLGNGAPINISSNQYVQLVYSQDSSPYGGGNNQSYYWTTSGYNGQYIQYTDVESNTSAWVEKDLYANGEIRTYGIFTNTTYDFSYGYSLQPSAERYGYALDIYPSGAYSNKLTLEPTGDYDIHVYESGSNGAVTLGRYGATNFRVYGPGGANNGGGQYGNDIRAELAANSSFTIKTYDTQDRVWRYNPDGSVALPNQLSSSRTGGGNFLKFPNDGYQKIIGTDNGDAGRNYVDRLVISGGDGFDTGEGGDIYLWAGRSGANGGTGGDIKVDAGNGTNSDGGTIKIRGGNSDTGTGGFIELWTGSGASGAPITLSAWNGGGWNQWIFEAHGNLTLPSGGDIKNYDGFSVIKSIPQNQQSGEADYQLVLSDAGKHVYKNDGAGYSVVVPTNADVAFEIGTAVTIVSGDSWTYVYPADSGTTEVWGAGYDQTSTSWYIPNNSMATLLKIGTDKWMLSGAGLAIDA